MTGSLFTLLRAQFPADMAKTVIETADGRRIAWRDLDAATAGIARLLADLGCLPGDRVAALVEKSPEVLFLYLACLRGGFVFLPMNPGYHASEVAYMLADAEPRVLVLDPSRMADVAPVAEASGVAHVLTLDGDGHGSLIETADARSPAFEPVEVDDNALAAILYTSGTTGKPKGARITHGNLASNGRVLVKAWGMTADDVLLHALPVFHVHGLFVACDTALLAGAKMLWLQRFDRPTVLELLPRATMMMGVPTFYTRLLDDPAFGRAQTAGMRLFIAGSAPLLTETHRAFTERTGHAVLERYGMTEIQMHVSNPLEGERRPGSIGLPLPGSEVRIVAEDGSDLPDGEIGQLLVRGPNVFEGYWRNPAKTAEDMTPDGWFRTGDLGSRAPDGYLTLVGRAKDLVITGGLNVYPIEIEELIDRLPGVAETAVIGLPHRDFGEAVTAVVKPLADATIDEDAIIAAVKAGLAGFKVPKRVVVVAELPRNAMGKVQKKALRDRFKDLYTGTGTT